MAITVNHLKTLGFQLGLQTGGAFEHHLRMLKESLRDSPGGLQGLASLSHVFQNKTLDTNEKNRDLGEERLGREKGHGSKGATDLYAQKDLRKTSKVTSPWISKLLTPNA